MITTDQYRRFMERLFADQRGKNPLCLNEFENSFLMSFVRSGRPSLWFTEKRAACADKMWRKLGPELDFPHPLDTADRPKAEIPDADPGGCTYLVRDPLDAGGRLQRRCNEPATVVERRGKLRYCATHAEAVKRALPAIVLDGINDQALR